MIKRLFKNEILRNIILLIVSVVIYTIFLFASSKIYGIAHANTDMSFLFLFLIIGILTSLLSIIYSFAKIAEILSDKAENKKCLKKIKEYLDDNWRLINLKTTDIPELHALIINNSSTTIMARFNENEEIHLIIKYVNTNTVLHDSTTTNYSWFWENVSF